MNIQSCLCHFCLNTVATCQLTSQIGTRSRQNVLFVQLSFAGVDEYFKNTTFIGTNDKLSVLEYTTCTLMIISREDPSLQVLPILQ